MVTPADLADLLDCEHRSILTQALAAGLPGAPRPGPGEPESRRRRATAAAMLARFRGAGREVAEIDVQDRALAAQATEEALRSGVPVIHRAVFLDGEFSAQADFLVQDAEGRYEVYDATPVRQATPAAVVRLTACADAVGRAGWPAGPHLHLRLSDGGTRTLRVEDFRPLVDRLRARLLGRPPRLPVPLWADERPACAGCGFDRHCAAGREADRDLSLVAGLRGDQRRISGVRGEAPPPTLKVALNTLGGFRNETTFV
ncbi:ATPase, partial [Amycolatopsis sp. NPDC026612]